MSPQPTRRELLSAGLTLAALPSMAWASADQEPREARLKFRLEETAGLRRFGFPVVARFDVPTKNVNFRLLRDGKVIPAQFRTVERPDGKSVVVLDFMTSMGPLDTEHYEVVFGTQVEAGPEPQGGTTLEIEDSIFRIGTRRGLHWEVPRKLSSWLTRSASGKNVYLDGGQSRLKVGLVDGSHLELTDPKVNSGVEIGVDRIGPLAIGLTHDVNLRSPTVGPEGILSHLELNFVSSKSWIELRWVLDDPKRVVRELEATSQLQLNGAPNVVDFGASSWVYEQLKPDESTTLKARPAGGLPRWAITSKTPKGGETLFAVSALEDRRPVEGWAHVFDDDRCSAIAVAEFARDTTDEIVLGGDGKVTIRREFSVDEKKAPQSSERSLVFWVHVVPTPVQVGAVTSPQAILAWPKVTWEPPSKG